MSREQLLAIDEAGVLRELVGELGVNLRLAHEHLDVQVRQRGNGLGFSGPDAGAAHRVFAQLAALVRDGRMLHPGEVRDALRLAAAEPDPDVARLLRDAIVHDRRNRPVTPRTPNQARYVDALRRHAVVFGVGPAGSGKTYLAVACAVASLRRGEVRRIVLSRPAVEAGEKLGFLPGDLTQKVDPYLRPLLDALTDLVEPADLERMMAGGIVEIAPLAFMRGRTLGDAFVVLDEAQNTTVEQMKMFLTRLGHGGRMAITGDPSQVDLPPRQRSGLHHAVQTLDHVDGVGVVRLTGADIVRHPLVASIVAAWEAREAANDGRRRDSEEMG